jgi:hypothetical protein
MITWNFNLACNNSAPPRILLGILMLAWCTQSEILSKEHCPVGCLSCEGHLETQSYLKKCLKCDLRYYEYLGSCINCPDKCLVCGSDSVCLRCDSFYSWEADICAFSWLTLVVRLIEILIVLGILYALLRLICKYRKQSEKYEAESEIKRLSTGKKNKKKNVPTKGKGAAKGGSPGKKKRKTIISIMDDSVD